jgi:tRNA-specific 2-thiouridylase
VQGHDDPRLFSRRLRAQDTSWVSGTPPGDDGNLAAKTRYRQADAPCSFAGGEGDFTLEFREPQWAVTPGQSAVLYRGEVCLGGGVIS